ncbi:universal stress protein [Raineyella sp. W15-4]|uniref:universal stress protein n=1 Tax=Raineyella sp. W15-4 TaxID=3081651 RepID=UPI002953F39B|nr:universal stress protein [Raineyella sp. W15-4]WOQ17297.1 universal stress protein [Raineyella sp. W15-4]
MSDIVVCCTDGSMVSRDAIAAGLSLLDRERWEVQVVTVVPDVIVDPGMPGPMPAASFTAGVVVSDPVAARRQALDTGQEIATETADHLGLGPESVQVLIGLAGPAVVEHARAVGAALVIAGSRGFGGAARFVLGSVSDHLVRHAPCPVLVGGEELSMPPAGPVVVCVDGSERSVRAGAAVVPLLARDLPLAVATVTAPRTVAAEGAFEEMAERRRAEEAEQILVSAATALGVPDTEFLSLTGANAADALVTLAREQPIRALVIGSRGHGGVVRAVLGSTADRVLREAPCLVCVVPADRQNATPRHSSTVA